MVLVVAVGCGTKAPPDPNDPSAVGIMQPEVLQRDLRWASDMVNERVAEGEISENEAKRYLTKYANELTEKVDFKQMMPSKAWEYAEVFRTAQRWELAKKALEMAVENAKKSKNEDRRVNDTLHLAQAEAQLGQRKEAIATARAVFDASEKEKAPILMAVLYEIIPALRGHEDSAEAAKLLEDAIDQHMKVQVDPNSESGKAFLIAKWHHIQKAWDTVVELYREAGKEDLASKAREKAAAMLDQQGRL